MADRPVPAVVDVKPAEQLLATLEQLLYRVHQQRLPEPPRPRQEIVFATLGQSVNVVRLIHIVIAPLADVSEGRGADWQVKLFHGCFARHSPAHCSMDRRWTFRHRRGDRTDPSFETRVIGMRQSKGSAVSGGPDGPG